VWLGPVKLAEQSLVQQDSSEGKRYNIAVGITDKLFLFSYVPGFSKTLFHSKLAWQC